MARSITALLLLACGIVSCASLPANLTDSPCALESQAGCLQRSCHLCVLDNDVTACLDDVQVEAIEEIDGACTAPETAPEPEPAPATPCKGLATHDECKAGPACAWCVNQFKPAAMGGSCKAASKAGFLPPKVFKCETFELAEEEEALSTAEEEAAPEPTPAPACKDLATRAECKADGVDCSWCELQKGVVPKGKCHTTAKAGFLPPAVYKCEAFSLLAAPEPEPEPTPEPTPAPACKDLATRAECKADGVDCSWCELQFPSKKGAASKGKCSTTAEAGFLPPAVYKCEAFSLLAAPEPEPEPTPEPTPAPACKDLATRDECKADGVDCSWCELQFPPKKGAASKGKCSTTAKAGFLPPAVYKCEAFSLLAAPEPEPEPTPEPTPAPACKDLATRAECKADGVDCSWCELQFPPKKGAAPKGKCSTTAEAGFLPPAVYKCEAFSLLAAPEPEPEPTPEPPLTCADLKTRKECIDGRAAPAPAADANGAADKAPRLACVYCENKFVPAPVREGECQDPAKAAGLPPAVFSCKNGKGVKPDVTDA